VSYEATKEGCLMARAALRDLAVLVVRHLPSPEAEGHIADIAAFLNAAERRLPTQAAVNADRERRKKYR
jgi:hypothetical protein